MADLFDYKVAGYGFHVTAHLLALAALFVACFAITGYITFRDESIPVKALDKDQDADDDIKVDNVTAKSLDVSGDATISDATISGVVSVTGPVVKTHPPNINRIFMGTIADGTPSLNTTGLANVDINKAEDLFYYFSRKTSLTAAESSKILVSGLDSQTATLTAAGAGALAGADGFATAATPQFLTGDFGTACDIGANNPFAAAVAGSAHLIIFGGNTLTAVAAVLTFTLSAAQRLDASGFNLLVSGDGNETYTDTAPGDDNSIDMTLTPSAANTKILAGSYLYIYHRVAQVGAVTYVKGLIKTTGGTLTVGFA